MKLSPRPLWLLAAVMVSGSPGLAQQTWIVDSQNRPGTQFTDLPAAIAGAQAGDVLVVRDGNYTYADITKGLQIHAEPGAIVDQFLAFPLGSAPFNIQDIPAGERVAVHGLTFGLTLWGIPVHLEVENCAGQVHLEDLTFGAPNVGTQVTSGLTITDCARVSLTRCDLKNRTGLEVTRSAAFALDSVFWGQDESIWVHGPTFAAEPGVTVDSGFLELSRCDVRGGSADINGFFSLAGASGITLANADLRLTGVAGTAVTAGQPSQMAGGSTAHFAIDGTGTVTVDPVVQLVSTGGVAATAPGINLATVEIPSLTVSSVQLGGLETGDLRAAAGQPYVVIVGLPANAIQLPFGPIWLDLSLVLIASSGIVGPSGTTGWTFPAPTQPVFVGEIFTWQAAALTSTGLAMSNAGEYVIR